MVVGARRPTVGLGGDSDSASKSREVGSRSWSSSVTLRRTYEWGAWPAQKRRRGGHDHLRRHKLDATLDVSRVTDTAHVSIGCNGAVTQGNRFDVEMSC